MNKPKLFQYAVLWHPTEKQAKEGEKSKIIVEPTMILAQDINAVNIQAAMNIPADKKAEVEQIEIAVRPF